MGFITLHYALLFPWVIFSGRVRGLWDQGLFNLFEKLILNPITWWDLNEWTKCSSKLLLLKHYMQELGEVGLSNSRPATLASRFLSSVYRSWKWVALALILNWKSHRVWKQKLYWAWYLLETHKWKGDTWAFRSYSHASLFYMHKIIHVSISNICRPLLNLVIT